MLFMERIYVMVHQECPIFSLSMTASDLLEQICKNALNLLIISVLMREILARKLILANEGGF